MRSARVADRVPSKTSSRSFRMLPHAGAIAWRERLRELPGQLNGGTFVFPRANVGHQSRPQSPTRNSSRALSNCAGRALRSAAGRSASCLVNTPSSGERSFDDRESRVFSRQDFPRFLLALERTRKVTDAGNLIVRKSIRRTDMNTPSADSVTWTAKAPAVRDCDALMIISSCIFRCGPEQKTLHNAGSIGMAISHSTFRASGSSARMPATRKRVEARIPQPNAPARVIDRDPNTNAPHAPVLTLASAGGNHDPRDQASDQCRRHASQA